MAKFLSRPESAVLAKKRRFARRGSFAPEFALLAPPFFLLLMGTVEFCLMLGAQQVLENAAFNGSRLAKTGFVAEELTQEQTINQVFTNALSKYGSMLDPTKLVVVATSYESFSGADTGGGTTGYGTEEQIVTYSITYPWKLFTPLLCTAMVSKCQSGIVNLKTTIVVRNEPYG
ncbi:MAG: TadE/TadG family type IV pilus assembly protein [Bdellovibrionales bacterium]